MWIVFLDLFAFILTPAMDILEHQWDQHGSFPLSLKRDNTVLNLNSQYLLFSNTENYPERFFTASPINDTTV